MSLSFEQKKAESMFLAWGCTGLQWRQLPASEDNSQMVLMSAYDDFANGEKPVARTRI